VAREHHVDSMPDQDRLEDDAQFEGRPVPHTVRIQKGGYEMLVGRS
jgi:hypothetical protein